MTIVFKIGTNVLFDNNCLNLEVMKKIVAQVGKINKEKKKVIIVASGAVASGKETIGKKSFPRTSLASLGQAKLIKHYYDFFEKQNIKIAQILVSPNCFKDRQRLEQLRETLFELMNSKVIPIVNENDATILENTFGDNDSLAAMIAVLSGAKKLVFLTNLDGLYSADPRVDKDAFIVKKVKNVNLEVQKMCSQETSSLGRGGMLSKLKGAKLATTCGVETYIINGLKPENITNLILKNKPVGTKFLTEKNKLSERKKWLLIGTVSQGKIIVDQGARKALENKNSLLAVGVRQIKGNFEENDLVNVVDLKGEVFAFGMVNYSSKKLMPLISLRDKKIIREQFPKEIIHIDNLSLLK